MDPEQLANERAASLERRKKKLEAQRRERPIQEPGGPRGLSRAARRHIKENDFVPPTDSEAPPEAP